MEEQRDVMDVDVLFVGGGIASLSGALHLTDLIEKHNEQAEKDGSGNTMGELVIAVLEKGIDIGSHCVSGAVMDFNVLEALVPDVIEKGVPSEGRVNKEQVLYLTKKGIIKAPFTPPPLDNHGNHVVSLSRLTKWLGQQMEERGVAILPGFAATHVLYDNNNVIGIRMGDKGVDAAGNKKPNFEPGADVHAKVTVFGDGSRGNLSKELISKLGLDRGKNPQTYAVGVKEVWEVPEGRIMPGDVVHTMGYPHPNHTYGGGFIYGMKNNMVSLGLLSGLDYRDPDFDPHLEFQRFKTHPFLGDLLEGGKIIQYGAKTVPVGGYFSIPKPYFNGGLLVGDAASLFNSQKIKGVHVAMKSGMIAAETIFEALLKDDCSEKQLSGYSRALFSGTVGKELHKARNFHQAFQKGRWQGILKAGIQYLLGGRILKDRLFSEPDHTHMDCLQRLDKNAVPETKAANALEFDGEYLLDKETDVYYAGTVHEEQQPPHLQILDLRLCHTRCTEEYNNPCTRFCPADVYEMAEDETTGERKLRLNFSNCVHCKTCDVKDPYENIRWVPPEGGGGPKYTLV